MYRKHKRRDSRLIAPGALGYRGERDVQGNGAAQPGIWQLLSGDIRIAFIANVYFLHDLVNDHVDIGGKAIQLDVAHLSQIEKVIEKRNSPFTLALYFAENLQDLIVKYLIVGHAKKIHIGDHRGQNSA